MKKPLFIAISGKKGSGKDELARQLMGRLSFDFQLNVAITHFADPLKEICIKLFGLNHKFVYGSNTEKETLTDVAWDGFPLEVRYKYANAFHPYLQKACPEDVGLMKQIPIARSGFMTHRELLQVMGTDIFRERVYNNVWAEYPFKQDWTMEKWEGVPEDDEIFDVVLIADCRFPNEVEETLNNEGLIIRINRNTGHSDNHPSETALDNYHWELPRHLVVDNNGSLEELRAKVSALAREIGELLRGK